jgi:O-succinylbenzoate synthase
MSSIGSLAAIRARAAEAAHFGADVVLSTAFESSYALRVAAHLAASIPNATRAHGIGTASLLAEDSCEPAVIRGGMLDGSPLPVPFAEAWS